MMYNSQYSSNVYGGGMGAFSDAAQGHGGLPYMHSNGPHPFAPYNDPSVNPRVPRPNHIPLMAMAPTMHPARVTRVSNVLPVRVIGEVSLKDFERSPYLGSAGAMRLYLLGKQVKHVFQVVEKDNWEQDKQRFAEAHSLPFVDMPVLAHNGLMLSGATAALRYLTKKLGEYGSDTRRDFIADAVTDMLTPWRSALDEVIEKNCVSADDPAITSYTRGRSSFLEKFENILARHADMSGNPQSTFFTGSTPMMCDFVMLSILYDDWKVLAIRNPTLSPHECNWLEGYNRLKELFHALASHPQIREFMGLAEADKGSGRVEESMGSGITNGKIEGHPLMWQPMMEQPRSFLTHPDKMQSFERETRANYSQSLSYEPPTQFPTARRLPGVVALDQNGFSYTPPMGGPTQTIGGIYPTNVYPGMMVGMSDNRRAGPNNPSQLPPRPAPRGHSNVVQPTNGGRQGLMSGVVSAYRSGCNGVPIHDVSSDIGGATKTRGKPSDVGTVLSRQRIEKDTLSLNTVKDAFEDSISNSQIDFGVQ